MKAEIGNWTSLEVSGILQPLSLSLAINMSLSYQVEHLAWKQRVRQELTSSAAFLDSHRDTHSSASSPPSAPSNFQPTAPSAEIKQSQVNLAYTFGGFTPARYAFKDSSAASFSVYNTHDCGTDSRPHKSIGVNTDQRPRTAAPPQRYIQELKSLVQAERKQREALERKLHTYR